MQQKVVSYFGNLNKKLKKKKKMLYRKLQYLVLFIHIDDEFCDVQDEMFKITKYETQKVDGGGDVVHCISNKIFSFLTSKKYAFIVTF